MFDTDQHIQQTLKAYDPERYLCCLYLPEEIRSVAMTLYAFDAEISRIPLLVSEPMPGEIRIQWWRDLIKSGGNVDSGPLAEALLKTIEDNNLPRDVFDNMLEARIFDLYQDPMPDMNTYEGYLGETVSSFFHMIALASGLERSTSLSDACGHAGVAIGMTRHLSITGDLRTRGQVYFPASVLQGHELNRDSWLSQTVQPNHIAVVSEMADTASDHFEKAKTAIATLPKSIRPVFLQIMLAQPLLKQIMTDPSKCLSTHVSLSALKRQWHAFRGLSRL